MDSPTNQPPPLMKSEDKLWVVISHLSLLLGFGLIVPFIVYLVKKDESQVIAFHSKEALNFHLSLYLYALLCIPLMMVVIGFPILILLGIAAFFLSIIAAVRGADGREYRYPLTIRFVG